MDYTFYIGTTRKDLFKISDGIEEWIVQIDKPGQIAIIENNGMYNNIGFKSIPTEQFKHIIKKSSLGEVFDLLKFLYHA